MEYDFIFPALAHAQDLVGVNVMNQTRLRRESG